MLTIFLVYLFLHFELSVETAYTALGVVSSTGVSDIAAIAVAVVVVVVAAVIVAFDVVLFKKNY